VLSFLAGAATATLTGLIVGRLLEKIGRRRSLEERPEPPRLPGWIAGPAVAIALGATALFGIEAAVGERWFLSGLLLGGLASIAGIAAWQKIRANS
jgi:hypothetical protein